MLLPMLPADPRRDTPSTLLSGWWLRAAVFLTFFEGRVGDMFTGRVIHETLSALGRLALDARLYGS